MIYVRAVMSATETRAWMTDLVNKAATGDEEALAMFADPENQQACLDILGVVPFVVKR